MAEFREQVVDYLVDPFVAGTSGSDPDSLSVHLLTSILKIHDFSWSFLLFFT